MNKYLLNFAIWYIIVLQPIIFKHLISIHNSGGGGGGHCHLLLTKCYSAQMSILIHSSEQVKTVYFLMINVGLKNYVLYYSLFLSLNLNLVNIFH